MNAAICVVMVAMAVAISEAQWWDISTTSTTELPSQSCHNGLTACTYNYQMSTMDMYSKQLYYYCLNTVECEYVSDGYYQQQQMISNIRQQMDDSMSAGSSTTSTTDQPGQSCLDGLTACTYTYQRSAADLYSKEVYYNCMQNVECKYFSDGYYQWQQMLNNIRHQLDYYNPASGANINHGAWSLTALITILLAAVKMAVG